MSSDFRQEAKIILRRQFSFIHGEMAVGLDRFVDCIIDAVKMELGGVVVSPDTEGAIHKHEIHAPGPLPESLLFGVKDWPSIEALEKRYIHLLLETYKDKKTIADIMGVDRTTLYRKLKAYDMESS